jgi:glycosyltransferase involved in cell wall biosynthesis
MTERVAIVYGTYNRLAYLQRAVASVRKAAGGLDVTSVVVDGGSTDGSRAWLAEQPDVVLIGQRGPLSGAVRAFNLGFGYACDNGFPFIGHFNDDAEFVTAGMLENAVGMLKKQQTLGEVAFEFDLRGSYTFERVNDRIYANYGLLRREVGMEVAKRQGDPSGRNWWNPIYKTYGADCEFGCWLWHLGYTIDPGHGLRVHDCNAQDSLRDANEANKPTRHDSQLFWRRWPSAVSFQLGPNDK